MLEHFSYSQLSMFTRCPKQWAFRYLDGIVTPSNGQMLRGTAYHEAVAVGYRNVIVYRSLPKIEELIQVYSDSWENGLKNKSYTEDGVTVAVPGVIFDDKDPGKLKDEGAELLKLYYAKVMPNIIPESIEVRKTRDFGDVKLIAYMDIIDWSGLVIDCKTASRSMSVSEVDTEFQSSFYGLVLGGNEINFELHRVIATKMPQIQIIHIHRSADDIMWISDTCNTVISQIKSGLFPPGSQGWWCGKSNCFYWGRCRVPRSF